MQAVVTPLPGLPGAPRPKDVMDGYLRVSRRGRRDGERFITLKQQRQSIEAWARMDGVRIAKWHQDVDRSGGTMERRGLNAALRRVESGATGGVVVARLDRFARTVSGGMATIERISGMGGRVVSIQEQLDPTTAAGRMMLTLLLAVAAWHREQAAENFEASIRDAAARDLFAVKTPYGLMKGDDGRLILHPDEAPIRLRIVSERAAGRGWRSIANGLHKDRIPTPKGGPFWNLSTLYQLVHAEANVGTWTGPYGLRVENAWPAICERELWEKATAIKGTRDDARDHQDARYQGKVRCANCRRVMRRNMKDGKLTYGCSVVGCSSVHIAAPRVDELLDQLVDARLARWRLRAVQDDDGTLTDLARQRDKLLHEFEQWRDDAAMRDALGDDDYRAGLLARAAARDDAAQALAIARAERSTGDRPDLPVDVTVRLADMEWEDRRRVTEAAVHAVWIRPAVSAGKRAVRDLPLRILPQFVDDSRLHELPSPRVTDLPPVTWERGPFSALAAAA